MVVDLVSELLVLKLLLHMTISFSKENQFNNCIYAIHGVQNYKETEAKHRPKLIMTHNFT